MTGLVEALGALSPLLLGVLSSLVASLGTGIGALAILAVPTLRQRAQDLLMSLGAGIMLAAAVYSLALPGLEAATARTGSPALGGLLTAVALLLGAAGVLLAHNHLPHEHFVTGPEGPHSARLRRAWLFVIAIGLHNFPEGLAVGVGFGGGDVVHGLTLLVAIFLQNLPEGFLVALALAAHGYRRRFALAVSAGTGFIELVGGVTGAVAVTLASVALPWAMGMAAGAMLFVISHEIIPETHQNGRATEATFGVIGGFALMLLFGSLLG